MTTRPRRSCCRRDRHEKRTWQGSLVCRPLCDVVQQAADVGNRLPLRNGLPRVASRRPNPCVPSSRQGRSCISGFGSLPSGSALKLTRPFEDGTWSVVSCHLHEGSLRGAAPKGGGTAMRAWRSPAIVQPALRLFDRMLTGRLSHRTRKSMYMPNL